MPAVTGILETSLYVADLGRSERFYRSVFGCPTKLGDDRMRALEVAKNQMLLLFAHGGSADGDDTPRGRIPGHDGSGTLHVAFAISENSINEWRAHLAGLKIEIISRVRPEQGGDSLYFHDPDGHVVELATPSIWSLP